MISAAILALVIQEDRVKLQFQPKVGDKFRYETRMEDASGKSSLPEGTKAYTIFKIAGEKDGKFTVHETIEVVSFGQPAESALFGTYKVDSQMNTEIIQTGEPVSAGGDGEAFATTLNGCFGTIFSSTPIRPNTEWKAPLDASEAVKKYLPAPPAESKPKYEIATDRTFSLQKFDDKSATIQSKINCKVDISGEDATGRHQIHIEQKFDQVASFDREIGMPIKLDRKFTLTMTSGGKASSIGSSVHLKRVS